MGGNHDICLFSCQRGLNCLLSYDFVVFVDCLKGVLAKYILNGSLFFVSRNGTHMPISIEKHNDFSIFPHVMPHKRV